VQTPPRKIVSTPPPPPRARQGSRSSSSSANQGIDRQRASRESAALPALRRLTEVAVPQIKMSIRTAGGYRVSRFLQINSEALPSAQKRAPAAAIRATCASLRRRQATKTCPHAKQMKATPSFRYGGVANARQVHAHLERQLFFPSSPMLKHPGQEWLLGTFPRPTAPNAASKKTKIKQNFNSKQTTPIKSINSKIHQKHRGSKI